MNARCYRCGRDFPQGQMLRREVVTSRLRGGSITGSCDYVSSTYNVSSLVDLCQPCSQKQDEAQARARAALPRMIAIILAVSILPFAIPMAALLAYLFIYALTR